jgi:hypothetical protein
VLSAQEVVNRKIWIPMLHIKNQHHLFFESLPWQAWNMALFIIIIGSYFASKSQLFCVN